MYKISLGMIFPLFLIGTVRCSGFTVILTADKTTVAVGDSVQFTGTITGDYVPPVYYDWFFGDGSSDTSSSNTISHTYTFVPTPNPVTVNVCVRDTADSQHVHTASISITVVGVTIDSFPLWLLVYKQGDNPTRPAHATGIPGGGTYQWGQVFRGTGRFDYMGGNTGPDVTLRGTAASSSRNDADVVVGYIYNGVEATDRKSLYMRTPVSTTSQADGDAKPCSTGFYRNYYHKLKDQFGDYIAYAGIGMQEDVQEVPPSDKAVSQLQAQTQNNYAFGISVRDYLYAPFGYCGTWTQKLLAQGFVTAPTYTITFTAVETSDFIVKRP